MAAQIWILRRFIVWLDEVNKVNHHGVFPADSLMLKTEICPPEILFLGF